MKSFVPVCAAALLFLAHPVLAGPLSTAQVTAGADWVVHADYDQFNKSELGRLIRAELGQLGLEQKMLDFETVFSFHPLDDIHSVTIYGSGDDQEKAVVLIDGTFETEKLVSLVRMNPQYERIDYGNFTLHSWVDENKKDPNAPGRRMYGCVYKDNLVLVSAGLLSLKQAVDVLAGTAPNAAGSFKQAVLDKKGAFLQLAVNAVGTIAQNNRKAALLRQTEELGAVFGEDEGIVYVNLSLKAVSEDVALNVKKMLDGIIAFMSIAGGEKPVLADIASQLDVTCVDRTITLYFRSEPTAVVSFLKERWKVQK